MTAESRRLVSYLTREGVWIALPVDREPTPEEDVVHIPNTDIYVDGVVFRRMQRLAGVRDYLRWFAGWAFGVN